MGRSSFQSLFDSDTDIRYFSLARHALVEAFLVLGLRQGDKVLLPEYLCRDLLASLYLLKLEPVWYQVTESLTPEGRSEEWPDAKAVLAVNYFGFPQNLAPFLEYSRRTGAEIIEDNAHGFLSKDCKDSLLGTRTALGIFSFRKTLLVGQGAGLAINCNKYKATASKQLQFLVESMRPEIRTRRVLRKICGSRVVDYYLARALRGLRVVRGLSSIPLPEPDAETIIPRVPNPSEYLLHELRSQNIPLEIERRRALYIKLEAKAKELQIKLVFPSLPRHVVPYALPIIDDNVAAIKELASSMHLDYFRWPDLPDRIKDGPVKHYKTIYLINLL